LTLTPDAPEALLSPSAEALGRLREALAGAPPDVSALVDSRNWREQLLGAAIVVLRGAEPPIVAGLWRAIDSISWVAPQLISAAFLVDDDFAAQAATRLLDEGRRPPKMVGALVRAFHRLPAPNLPVVAQLGRHDRVMITEEARIGVRAVDWWLDRLPQWCEPDERARWRRQAGQLISRSS
jgi:hypothetical protein